MKINDDGWLEAISDYQMGVCEALGFDGILVKADKRQQYTNIGPSDTRLPIDCNTVESSGASFLIDWTKVGNSGVCNQSLPIPTQCFDPGVTPKWDIPHDKPSFRGSPSNAWFFSRPKSTRLDWFYGFVKYCDLAFARTQKANKILVVDWYSHGVHPFGWASAFIADIAADKGISTSEAATFFYGEILRTIDNADFAFVDTNATGAQMPDDFWDQVVATGTTIIDPTRAAGN